MSFHKNRMTTCNNTLVQRHNIIDNDRVNNEFLCQNNVRLKALKSHFKGPYVINRILHSWSFHMKIMKLAEG